MYITDAGLTCWMKPFEYKTTSWNYQFEDWWSNKKKKVGDA
jgi:hypothetical protein